MFTNGYALALRLWRAIARMRGGSSNEIIFAGDFASWGAAKRSSSGYEAGIILEKTRQSLLQVKHGRAAFERDSVLFDTPQYPLPLLACLLRIALTRGASLSVLDFGGSLGSSYFQCRSFLEAVRPVRWSVVEQAHYVACGKAEFEDADLRFYYRIEDCLEEERPDVLLLSSVVQYLERPYEFLRNAVAYRIPYILVDRTAFIRRDRDLLTVERVPEWIYPASYPAWFLRESEFVRPFAESYRMLAGFPGADQVRVDGQDVYFRGFLFARSNVARTDAAPTFAEAVRQPRMRDEISSGLDQH